MNAAERELEAASGARTRAATRRASTGLRAHLSGLGAEDAVQRHYARAGATLAHARWRRPAGEIDLIVREGASVVFVEVKKAATHAAAAARVSARQIARIQASASEFLGGEPAGQNTDCRFDVALVDAQGRIEIIPNVMAA